MPLGANKEPVLNAATTVQFDHFALEPEKSPIRESDLKRWI